MNSECEFEKLLTPSEFLDHDSLKRLPGIRPVGSTVIADLPRDG
jgi:hypothetical protein